MALAILRSFSAVPAHAVFGVFMGRQEELRQIVELVSRGTMRGVVDQTFPLQQASEAHKAMESLGFFGKLILTIP